VRPFRGEWGIWSPGGRPSGGGLFTFGHAERTLFICGSEQSLAAAVVSRGTTCVPQKKTRRAGHDAAGKLGVSVKKRGEPTTDSLVRLKRPPLSRIVEVPLVRQSHGASSLV
jgi:hypothetical protein